MKKKERKRKVNHFNLKEEYRNCYNFLKDSREFVFITILVFFIFVAVGFFFEDLIDLFFRSVFGINLNEKIILYLKSIVESTAGMNQTELTGFIFINNLKSSLFGILFGVFFGIFPLVAAIFNGYLLGFVAMISVQSQGFFVLWRILPHGIFELPAVFISLGLGLRLGSFLFRRKEQNKIQDYLLNCLRVFLLVVFPLLIIAALIEGILIAFS